MFGIYEVIVLALALGGFGVQANPKAPSPDVVLEYGVEDADIVAYVDAVPLIPGNYTALKKLPDLPEIKSSPVLRDLVGKIITEVETARGTLKTVVGVDLTTDLSNVTLFAHMAMPPEVLVVGRGKFPADLPTKIAKMMGGKPEELKDAQAVTVGGPFELVAINKAGVLLAGSRRLVAARLAADWKAPARPKGSILAEAAQILGDKPVYMAAASFSSGRIAKLLESVGGTSATSFVDRFVFVGGAMHHNGVGWVMVDKDAGGHARSVMASEGWIDLFRAAQLAPRGIAKVLVSFLDDIKTTDPELVELKNHKDELLELVNMFTGDGNFKVKIDKDPRTFRLVARATGKRLSDVVPLGLVVPGMALALFTRSKAPATTSVAVPPPPAPKPRTGGGIATPPKPAPKAVPKPVSP